MQKQEWQELKENLVVLAVDSNRNRFSGESGCALRKDALRSYIDTGSSISVAAKITTIARPGQVVIGEDVYSLIDPALKNFGI